MCRASLSTASIIISYTGSPTVFPSPSLSLCFPPRSLPLCFPPRLSHCVSLPGSPTVSPFPALPLWQVSRKQQHERVAEQRAEWERRLKQEDDAARARSQRDSEERLRRWREESDEAEKRQKRSLEEASEVCTLPRALVAFPRRVVSGVSGVRHGIAAWGLVIQHCGLAAGVGGPPREAAWQQLPRGSLESSGWRMGGA
jgi:hypothetical protein